MLTIKFYNERGQVTFCGGGSGRWKLTAADGLSLCGRTFKTAKYAGQAGQQTLETVVNPRTITLSGDVETDENFLEEYQNVIGILGKEGILEIATDQGKRNINAKCCEFCQGEKKGRYMLFVVQFICDNPYFKDPDKVEVPIFKEIPLLDKNFSLPGVFSRRIARKNLVYEGNAETEPVFYINVEEVSDGDAVLSIINHTSGECLNFNYGASENESIILDIENRSVYNSYGDDLLQYLADDSFFDGFHLYPGANDIEVINYNTSAGVGVSCTYSNQYLEAVYV